MSLIEDYCGHCQSHERIALLTDEVERLRELVEGAAWCWCSTLLEENFSGRCGGCKILRGLKMPPFHESAQAALKEPTP